MNEIFSWRCTLTDKSFRSKSIAHISSALIHTTIKRGIKSGDQTKALASAISPSSKRGRGSRQLLRRSALTHSPWSVRRGENEGHHIESGVGSGEYEGKLTLQIRKDWFEKV